MWGLINKADNALIAIYADAPTPTDDQYVSEQPDGTQWDQARAGWVWIPAPVLLSIAAFMLLFTQAERLAIRAARAIDPLVDDFWELMLACTSGISLQHPMVIAGVQHLETAALIASDRAAAVLAGSSPD
jgi:hypothetical protein